MNGFRQVWRMFAKLLGIRLGFVIALTVVMTFAVSGSVAARGPIWGFPSRGYTPPPVYHWPTPTPVHTPTPTPPPAPQPQPANPFGCGTGFSTQYGNADVNVTSSGVPVVLSMTNTSYSLNIDNAVTFSNYHTSLYYNHNGCGNDEVRIAGNNQAQTAGFSLYARNNNGVYTFTLSTWGNVTHYSLSGVTSGTMKIVPKTYY